MYGKLKSDKNQLKYIKKRIKNVLERYSVHLYLLILAPNIKWGTGVWVFTLLPNNTLEADSAVQQDKWHKTGSQETV